MKQTDKESLERINKAVDKCADVLIESGIFVSESIAVLARLYAWIELESKFGTNELDLMRSVFFQAVDSQKKKL